MYKSWTYKGAYIERNIHGYYYTYTFGLMMADTLNGLKRLISDYLSR